MRTPALICSIIFDPVTLTGAILAQQTTAQKAAWNQNISGTTDYFVACAACHGRSGKGGGPVASELRIIPPDLTMLAKKNDPVFPAKAVEEIIDGVEDPRQL